LQANQRMWECLAQGRYLLRKNRMARSQIHKLMIVYPLPDPCVKPVEIETTVRVNKGFNNLIFSLHLVLHCFTVQRVIFRTVSAEFVLTLSCLCMRSCSDCASPLTSWYCQREGRLLCKEHYRRRFDEACNHCAVRITGPVMVRQIIITMNIHVSLFNAKH